MDNDITHIATDAYWCLKWMNLNAWETIFDLSTHRQVSVFTGVLAVIYVDISAIVSFYFAVGVDLKAGGNFAREEYLELDVLVVRGGKQGEQGAATGLWSTTRFF